MLKANEMKSKVRSKNKHKRRKTSFISSRTSESSYSSASSRRITRKKSRKKKSSSISSSFLTSSNSSSSEDKWIEKDEKETSINKAKRKVYKKRDCTKLNKTAVKNFNGKEQQLRRKLMAAKMKKKTLGNNLKKGSTNNVMKTNNKVTWQPPIDFDDEISESQCLIAPNNKNVVFKGGLKTVEDVEESDLKPPGIEIEETKTTSDSVKNKLPLVKEAVQNQHVSNEVQKKNKDADEKSSDDIDMFDCDSPKSSPMVSSQKISENIELVKLQKSRKENAKLMKSKMMKEMTKMKEIQQEKKIEAETVNESSSNKFFTVELPPSLRVKTDDKSRDLESIEKENSSINISVNKSKQKTRIDDDNKSTKPRIKKTFVFNIKTEICDKKQTNLDFETKSNKNDSKKKGEINFKVDKKSLDGTFENFKPNVEEKNKEVANSQQTNYQHSNSYSNYYSQQCNMYAQQNYHFSYHINQYNPYANYNQASQYYEQYPYFYNNLQNSANEATLPPLPQENVPEKPPEPEKVKGVSDKEVLNFFKFRSVTEESLKTVLSKKKKEIILPSPPSSRSTSRSSSSYRRRSTRRYGRKRSRSRHRTKSPRRRRSYSTSSSSSYTSSSSHRRRNSSRRYSKKSSRRRYSRSRSSSRSSYSSSSRSRSMSYSSTRSRKSSSRSSSRSSRFSNSSAWSTSSTNSDVDTKCRHYRSPKHKKNRSLKPKQKRRTSRWSSDSSSK